MKMISIEDLKRRIKEKFCNSCSTPYKDTDVIEMGEYCCDMVSDTMAFVDELPTIEAEPDKMLRDTIAELCQAKRLLKAAVEDIHELLCDKKNLGGNGQSCNICSYIEQCSCCEECTIREDLRNWRYADVAVELIGEGSDSE